MKVEVEGVSCFQLEASNFTVTHLQDNVMAKCKYDMSVKWKDWHIWREVMVHTIMITHHIEQLARDQVQS